MNLAKFKNIVKVINSATIDQAIIECDGAYSKIRAVNDSKSSAVVHTLPFKLEDKKICIPNVKELSGKLDLFDVKEATISASYKDEYVTRITISQGRRRVVCNFAHESTIRDMPSSIKRINISNELKFSRQEFNNISRVVSMFNSPYVSFTGSSNGDIMILMESVNSDKFEDIVGNTSTSNWSYRWPKQVIFGVMKSALTDDVKIGISDAGIGVIICDEIPVLVFPSIE